MIGFIFIFISLGFLLGALACNRCGKMERRINNLETQNAQRAVEIEALQRRAYTLEVKGFVKSLTE